MVKDIYESICRGEDVRANLICLKQLIADKKEKVHLLICWQAIFENWQLY